MKNVLVTGGAGFIGSGFVHLLLSQESVSRVTVLDLLTYAGARENLMGLPRPIESLEVSDIADREAVLRALRREEIDTIVNFAAETHVDRSIHDPVSFLRTNVVGTWILLEAARQVWGDRKDVRFHHVSTDEVYGSLLPGDPGFTEATPYDPSSPYSASKAAADHFVRAYHRTFGLPVTISNSSNNYGPRQYPEKLVPLAILAAMEGREIPVYGDGRQRRDWIHVDDHSRALLEILRKGMPGWTYNVGGNAEVENLEILGRIVRLVDEECGPLPSGKARSSLFKTVADRPGHDRRYSIDAGRIRSTLGWEPRETLDSGLRKTVAWYASNPEWVEQIRSRGGYQEWIQKNYEGRA